jgi:hypothetical protein
LEATKGGIHPLFKHNIFGGEEVEGLHPLVSLE